LKKIYSYQDNKKRFPLCHPGYFFAVLLGLGYWAPLSASETIIIWTPPKKSAKRVQEPVILRDTRGLIIQSETQQKKPIPQRPPQEQPKPTQTSRPTRSDLADLKQKNEQLELSLQQTQTKLLEYQTLGTTHATGTVSIRNASQF
jgi:hypothetical protein